MSSWVHAPQTAGIRIETRHLLSERVPDSARTLVQSKVFAVGFELRQDWDISESGRHRVPNRWRHETEGILSSFSFEDQL